MLLLSSFIEFGLPNLYIVQFNFKAKTEITTGQNFIFGWPCISV